MFNVKEIEKYSNDETKVVVRGTAASTNNNFNYSNGGVEAFFNLLEEVESAEVIYHRDHVGGDSKYAAILTPAEGFTVENLIEEVPLYQPVDSEGKRDTQEFKSDYTGLNIFEDGQPAAGRARHTLYKEGV